MERRQPPGQHEDIQVNQTIVKNRKKIVRQTRKDVSHLECFFESNQLKLRVLNISAFGLLIKSKENLSAQVVEGNLIINNLDLGPVHLKLVRSTESSEGHFAIAYEVVGEPISVDCIQSIEDVQQIVNSLDESRAQATQVPDLFARKIYEIKDWLEYIQDQTRDIEKKMSKIDSIPKADYESAFIQCLGEYLNEVMPIKNADLSAILGQQNADGIKACYEFMREKLKGIIYQAPFSNRVFYKPLGYAGDYEMMNIIYDDNPLGESLFAKCLHYYWVKQPAAQAVRNRAVYMQKKIKSIIESHKQSSPLRFLSVACGPAMEWQNILKQNNSITSEIQVTLLDQDETALIHAQRKMRELSQNSKAAIKFKYEHKAIKNILARGLDEEYDVIYSAGLFDYFSDPVATLAGRKLFGALKPGGQLIIGNFDVSNPNTIVMDSALDWRLLYRAAEDMHKLFGDLGGKISIEHEPLKINLFCVIEKV